MQRRDFILAALMALGAPAAGRAGDSSQRFEAIEKHVAGRLGVALVDAGSGRRLAYRADERFPMCSTFKWLLAAQVLARVDRGEERLERRVAYGPADLLEYAPVAREHVSEGALSVSAL